MDTRVGLIGTGWVTAVHLNALKQIPGVRVAAIAGIEYDKASEMAGSVGGKAYEDYNEMLRNENLDAAYILMPPHVHGEMEKACAEHVPAVFIEKPVGNNLSKPLEIEKMFKDAGTIVATGYMMRYLKSVERAKAIFDNSVNKPVLLSGSWVNPMPEAVWWKVMEKSAGQFVEQCTHLVDTARYIVGEITEVSAYSAKGFVKGIDGYTIDDAMTVNVKFETGAVGSFITGCFPVELSPNIGLTIESRDARCSFSQWGMGLDIECNNGDKEHFDEATHDIFIVEDSEFLKAVVQKSASGLRSSYSNAVKTLRVTLAANESCKTGKPVLL